MNKTLRYIVNVVLFVVIIAFTVFIIKSLYKDEVMLTEKQTENTFESKYKKTGEVLVGDTILSFDVFENKSYVMTSKKLKVFDSEGALEKTFPVKTEVRDLLVVQNRIWLLFPTSIEVLSLQGEFIQRWEACSALSDYCSFTITNEMVFVTDAANKNICVYTTEGAFKRFIESPRGFITPSYAFDITSSHDTIYCVNPGRHLIESYTSEGEFIAAFGGPGTENGYFSGCDNPAYICMDQQGTIFTSEKGLPRISNFDKNGTFNELILNHRLLGAGNKAHEIKCADTKLWVSNLSKIDIYEHK